MGFNESYKHLEKLCSEVMNAERGVSAYIDAMENTPRGASLVSGWSDDLKELKHYRWIRNRIAHDPGCTEQNMTKPVDAMWVDRFYSRIMNQTDPLALYYKALKPRPASKQTQAPKHTYPQQSANEENTSQKALGFLVFLLGIILIVAAMYLFSKI